MKHLLASGALAATLVAAGPAACAQPVENTRPPVFATQDYYGDASQPAPHAGAGASGSRERRPSYYGTGMYDSHNPAGNSAKWGVGG